MRDFRKEYEEGTFWSEKGWRKANLQQYIDRESVFPIWLDGILDAYEQLQKELDEYVDLCMKTERELEQVKKERDEIKKQWNIDRSLHKNTLRILESVERGKREQSYSLEDICTIMYNMKIWNGEELFHKIREELHKLKSKQSDHRNVKTRTMKEWNDLDKLAVDISGINHGSPLSDHRDKEEKEPQKECEECHNNYAVKDGLCGYCHADGPFEEKDQGEVECYACHGEKILDQIGTCAKCKGTGKVDTQIDKKEGEE